MFTNSIVYFSVHLTIEKGTIQYINNSVIIETVMRRSDKVHSLRSGIKRAESPTVHAASAVQTAQKKKASKRLLWHMI